MPSKGRAPSIQVPEDGLDRPPSSNFVTRAGLRAHFVTVQTFSQFQDDISSMLQPNQGNSQPVNRLLRRLLVWLHKIHLRLLSTILVLTIPKPVHRLNCGPIRQMPFSPISQIFCLPPSIFPVLH